MVMTVISSIRWPIVWPVVWISRTSASVVSIGWLLVVVSNIHVVVLPVESRMKWVGKYSDTSVLASFFLIRIASVHSVVGRQYRLERSKPHLGERSKRNSSQALYRLHERP